MGEGEGCKMVDLLFGGLLVMVMMKKKSTKAVAPVVIRRLALAAITRAKFINKGAFLHRKSPLHVVLIQQTMIFSFHP